MFYKLPFFSVHLLCNGCVLFFQHISIYMLNIIFKQFYFICNAFAIVDVCMDVLLYWRDYMCLYVLVCVGVCMCVLSVALRTDSFSFTFAAPIYIDIYIHICIHI